MDGEIEKGDEEEVTRPKMNGWVQVMRPIPKK